MNIIGLFLYYAIKVYFFIIFLRVIISWFPFSGFTTIKVFFIKITEPILKPIRRKIGVYRSGNVAYDLSPIIVIIMLYILQRLVVFVFFTRRIF